MGSAAHDPLSSNAHLRVIDEHGEVLDNCPSCVEYAKQLRGAEKEIRAWRARYANLENEREAKALSHKLWGLAVALFHEWKIAANHPRSGWNAERFWLCEPYLRADGFVECRWAVWGVAFCPNTKTLPTGLVERYDSWELCFKNRATFERYVNRGHAHPDAKKQFAHRLAEEDAEKFSGTKGEPLK